MTIRNLDRLLRPASRAVIGASDRPGSVGAVVMRNLAAARFAGTVMPVNPKHAEIAGYGSVADLDIGRQDLQRDRIADPLGSGDRRLGTGGNCRLDHRHA
jgi:CoA binding domain